MTLYVALSDEERARYERARELYRGFVQQSGIDMRKPDGWSKFLYVAFRSPEGREAFQAYREQRNLGPGRAGEAQAPGTASGPAFGRPCDHFHA